MGASGSVARTTGYVLGAFAKTITATGNTTWEVGSSTDYLPISMNVTSLTGHCYHPTINNNSPAATTFVGTTSKAIAHYYNIGIGSGITSITAIPTLSFTSTEFSALTGTGGDQTKLFLAEWVEGSWNSQRTNSTLASAAGGSPGTVTLNSGVSGFSPWAIFWGTEIHRLHRRHPLPPRHGWELEVAVLELISIPRQTGVLLLLRQARIVAA